MGRSGWRGVWSVSIVRRTSLRTPVDHVARSLLAVLSRHSAGVPVQKGQHPIPATTGKARGMRTESEDSARGDSHVMPTICPAHAVCVGTLSMPTSYESEPSAEPGFSLVGRPIAAIRVFSASAAKAVGARG